jgi:hypothetical protein
MSRRRRPRTELSSLELGLMFAPAPEPLPAPPQTPSAPAPARPTAAPSIPTGPASEPVYVLPAQRHVPLPPDAITSGPEIDELRETLAGRTFGIRGIVVSGEGRSTHVYFGWPSDEPR